MKEHDDDDDDDAELGWWDGHIGARHRAGDVTGRRVEVARSTSAESQR